MKEIRIILSGGGTGGHIFPAISIANALKSKCPNANILFVGAEKRMEMERVPAAGYPIIGLPVRGFNRSNLLSNFRTLYDLLLSLLKARRIVKEFKPDVAVGVGGYASGPLLRAAAALGVPTLIQEQNSYAGVTNKLLASKAARICVAYTDMERYFPKEKILLTGNPVRQDLVSGDTLRQQGMVHFGLNPTKKTLLIVGGSLGSRTLNESVLGALDVLETAENLQVIWQTGRYYYKNIQEQLKDRLLKNVKVFEFVQQMDFAYAVADLIISRAGASSISEFCLLKKAVILVPSPNVAEDHQTKNALALVKEDAAVMIRDSEARSSLISEALQLINQTERLKALSRNIVKLAQFDSAGRIADEILKLIPEFSHIYFIGIGGIGMSNLARYYVTKGKVVAGYDKTRTVLTKELEKEGISIHYKDGPSAIPSEFLKVGKTLVVRTPAVPEDLSELRLFVEKGFRVLKRAELLGIISKESKGLCIAGTHGKTTTSMLTAHLLKQSHVDCSAFLGGISNNYNTNLLLSEKSDLTVIEADEYDRSFHSLLPWMAVVTSVDPDHLDIYGSHEAYLESFAHFTELIRPGGCLIIKKGLPLNHRLQPDVRTFNYSVTEKADYYADNIRYTPGRLFFDFYMPEGSILNMELGVPIRVNVENAVAAMALAHLNGVTDQELREALASFKGTRRRFDIQVKRDDFVYIDDYAHHPEELRASIQSIKELFPGKKVTGIFQPHLYSRTKDFADDFADVLSGLDDLILLEIYPARELPIPGVTSKMILDKVNLASKTVTNLTDVFNVLDKKTPEVLVTLGAGNIDTLVPLLRKRYEP